MDDEKKIIPSVEKVDSRMMGFVIWRKAVSGWEACCRNLLFTRLASSLGIRVIISGIQGELPLQSALEGKTGTTFKPQKSNLKARQKWLASGSITIGSISVDKGAEKALQSRKSCSRWY
jgi:glutamate 5-kinase